jgi:O-antigen/teichoic acid export membrane protein
LTETAVAYNVPRGTAYITYQQVVIYLTAAVYYVLLIRVLNLSQVGEVSLLTGAMAFFTTLTQLALPPAATRFISASVGGRNQPDASGVARTALRLTLAIAGPGLLIGLLASPWLGITIFKSSNSGILLLVTFAAGFLIDLTTLYGAFFLGLGYYAEMVYQNILYVPLSRGLGLALAYKGLGPLGIPLGWALGALATLLLSLYLWKGKLSRSSRYPTRSLLVFSLPLFASALITLLQSWGDIALLQGIIGQFGTTGAYYIVVSSVAFLSILWSPATGALYPALSSGYAEGGPRMVSEKLEVASRLVNLTVLPTGAALAAIAPTALEAVYGSSLGNQAVPFAILAVTIIFSAQSLLLITSLQAVGKTTYILGISLAATAIDLATVGFGASALGTTAGAIGRALLSISMAFLAWLSLRTILHAQLTKGLSKAVAIALSSAAPLIFVDNILTFSLHLTPILRLPGLLGVFAICFLSSSRMLSAFTDDDFELLDNALPEFLRRPLKVLELLVRRN